MNAAKAPRRLSGRREDGLPSLPAPNSSGGGLSFVSSSSSSSSSRSRFASLLAEKKSDGYPSSFLGPVGGGNPGAAATPHKVWLGSLPSTLTESELRERLACFGTIQSFFFKPEQPGAAVLAADQPQQNKKARGWAFVSYSTAEEAQALIKAVDGKTPEAVFPVAASSLIAPGAAPPVEARLANASKNIASSGSLSTTTASDSRTVFSEEEPHSREKLLALAFFSPSHKPSAAGRASSLAPGRASSVAPSSSGMTAAGDAAAAGNSSSSSLRCSSHPRINNSSSLDKLDGTGILPGAGNGPVVGNNLSDFSGQSMNPRAGGAPPFSRSLMNNSHASYRGGPASNTGPAGGHQAVTELQKQHARLAEEEEEAPPPPAPTSFPLPPAGSGGNSSLSQLAANEKAAAMNAAANAAGGGGGGGGGGIPQKIQETAAMPSAAGDNGGAFPPPAAAAAPAPAGAAPAPGAVLAGAAPAPPSGGVSARAAALATPAPMDQPQQPALNGGGVAGAAAGAAAGADSGPQRGRRPYSGGAAGAAGLPLSGGGGAAAGAAAPHIGGGPTGRPQQQQPGRIDGPGLPSLWEVYWTPDTQQPYYYNALSKHVQWERPLPPRDYVEQYGNPMTEELGPPAPLIPGVTRGVVAGKGGAVVGPQGSNLFVFHLPPEWTEQTFLRHFAPFGNVVSCKIQVNNQTGKRGGFGFVSYDNPASAIASIRMLNGFAACGKMLKVQLKKGEEHLLPPDLLLQQQQQQQHQHPHGSHAPPTPPPLGFTYSAAA